MPSTRDSFDRKHAEVMAGVMQLAKTRPVTLREVREVIEGALA